MRKEIRNFIALPIISFTDIRSSKQSLYILTPNRYLYTFVNVSDSVTDVVMSSLQTCNMNYGSRQEGLGRVKEQGVNS
jgi:hypothetical protein